MHCYHLVSLLTTWQLDLVLIALSSDTVAAPWSFSLFKCLVSSFAFSVFPFPFFIVLNFSLAFYYIFVNRIYVSPFLCIFVSLGVNCTAWYCCIKYTSCVKWDGVYVRWRTNTAKELVSHDARSNVYNYKHVFSVEIVPVCKDDVVCLPATVARQLGNMSQICVVLRVTQVVHLIDINTCHSQCSMLFSFHHFYSRQPFIILWLALCVLLLQTDLQWPLLKVLP